MSLSASLRLCASALRDGWVDLCDLWAKKGWVGGLRDFLVSSCLGGCDGGLCALCVSAVRASPVPGFDAGDGRQAVVDLNLVARCPPEHPLCEI